MIEKYETKDEAGTFEIAATFAKTIKPSDIIALTGELGTGKTVFARGVASALGVKEKVTSPTFTLINEYHGDFVIYHMDFYRLDNLKEILDIGVDDYFFRESICLIEWAEKMGEMFPEEAIWVIFRHLKNNYREIKIKRHEYQ